MRTIEYTRLKFREKKTTGSPESMLLGFERDFPDVIVHLGQAAINPTEKRREKEDRSVTDTLVAKHYKDKEY